MNALKRARSKESGVWNSGYEREDDDEELIRRISFTSSHDYQSTNKQKKSLEMMDMASVIPGPRGSTPLTAYVLKEAKPVKKITLLELSKQCIDLEYTKMMYSPGLVVNVGDVWMYGHRKSSVMEFFDITPKPQGFSYGKSMVWM